VVLLIVKDSIPLKGFAFKLRKYYPLITYRKALSWVESGRLPIWPRLGKERILVRISKLDSLFRLLGFDETTIEAILRDFRS
jgi:hypothetical protein